jgi:hypothetical protein
MEIPVCNVGLLHFAFKTALEYALAFGLLESVDFQQDF